MSYSNDFQALQARYSDEYVQRMSKASSGRIGGECKRINDMQNNLLMGEHAEQLAGKLIDACIFRNSSRIFDVMSDRDRADACISLEINANEFTPYHVTSYLKVEILDNLQSRGFNNYADYINTYGFEKLILFILAVGNNAFKNTKNKAK